MYTTNLNRLEELIEDGSYMAKIVKEAFENYLRYDEEYLNNAPQLVSFLKDVGVLVEQSQQEERNVSRHNFVRSGS